MRLQKISIFYLVAGKLFYVNGQKFTNLTDIDWTG